MQVKPFARQCWAALHSKGKDSKSVFLEQVLIALTWVHELVREPKLLRAVRFLRPGRLQAAVASDASPVGGGALLYIFPAEVQITMEAIRSLTPWAWMQRRWTTYDETIAESSINDPGSQARWEAYAIISALIYWAKVAFETRGTVTVIGDALGVMFGANALHSADAHINRLFMELALVVAPNGRSLEAVHVWSEDNSLADELSRMLPDTRPPASLQGVRRTPWREDIDWIIIKRV